MSQTTENNKRIAKNTLALYIRTLVTMVVGLYTSRVVLNVLGVDDYGLYNVVGGVVAMFSILTATLSQAISRYFTFELGKENSNRLHIIFCTGVNIQLLMSVIVIFIAEIGGVWFLNAKMNIPPDRMVAANWVLQFSILAFVVSLISVPYNAVIIAHEKMKAFAYVSVLEAILKLTIAYILFISPVDKLITYGFLLLLVSIVIRFVYGHYCHNHFDECHYEFILDKTLLLEMAKFAGLNAITCSAFMFNTQGINILSNLFFGVAINAARGVALQVDTVIRGFVANFTTAAKPQIIKYYSSGDYGNMMKLVCSSTKYSYFLMLVFAIPFIFEADELLKIWLKTYPSYAPCFVRWSMFVALITLLGEMLYVAILATGKLKKYVALETAISIFVFPVSYLLFLINFPSYIPYLLMGIVYFVLMVVRLVYLRQILDFSIKCFLNEACRPVVLTTVLTLLVCWWISHIIYGKSVLLILSACILMALTVCISIFLVGLAKAERKYVIDKIINYARKIK